MSTHLQITGTEIGTWDLNGPNSGYATIHLDDGWSPAVAKISNNTMGNRSIYGQVAESPPIWLEGATKKNVTDTLEALAFALQKAEDWRNRITPIPVIVEYNIDGSTLASPLEAVITASGLSSPDQLMSLPVTFNKYLNAYVTEKFTYSFVRRGRWLGEEESTDQFGGSDVPATVIMSFVPFSTNAQVPSPLDINLVNNTAGSPADLQGYLVHANETGRIRKYEAESGSYTNMATAAETNASAGNVARTSTGATYSRVTYPIVPSLDARLFTLLGIARNHSDNLTANSITYRIEANAGTGLEWDPVYIPYGDGQSAYCTGFSFGTIAVNPDAFNALSRIEIEIYPDATPASGDELDLDYLILLENKRTSGVIKISDIGTFDIRINHRLLESVAPIASRYDSGLGYTYYGREDGNLMIDHEGDDFFLVLMPWNSINFVSLSTYTCEITRRLARVTPA